MGDHAGDPGGSSLIVVGERADAKCLEFLTCPFTKTVLIYDEKRQELISRAAHLAFPIRSGVPLMTREAARNLDEPFKNGT